VIPTTTRVFFPYWLLGLAQAAHSMEETRNRLYDTAFWAMTGMIRAQVSWFPQFRMEADSFVTLNMFFIALLLGTSPMVWAGARWAIWFAAFVGIVETLNGIAHLSAAVYFGTYWPGAFTAPFLVGLGIWLLIRLRQQGALR
jgi:hypothetical protein